MTFKTFIKDATVADKHVPFIEIHDNKVSIKCGKDAMHPTTDAHYIGWIKLFGLKDAVLLELGTAQFYPGLADPVALFSVTDIKKYSKLVATIYCNLHGIYQNEIEVPK